MKSKNKTLDPHVGCYSYPNCNIDPNGCCLMMGDDVEEYGFKDKSIENNPSKLWKTISDQEILDIHNSSPGIILKYRAFEAKLKEKNS